MYHVLDIATGTSRPLYGFGDRVNKIGLHGVDPTGQVIGVDALRVADSSIFPRIPNGNLNAPSIMVGEKISDHVLGLDPLPSSNDQPWISPRWQDAQR